jgi:hypothetical protein
LILCPVHVSIKDHRAVMWLVPSSKDDLDPELENEPRVQSIIGMCVGFVSICLFFLGKMTHCAEASSGFKGIVSRKFKIRFWYHSKAWKFLHLFLFYLFLKISSFSYRIIEYLTFSSEVLLSYNTVNELCSVAQFVNSIVTY